MYKIPANTLFIGNQVHYLPSCHSTNRIAADLIQKGAPQGTVVITDDQYEGKGQVGNTWESEPGANLTFSILLYPKFLLAKDQFELTKATTMGIIDFLNNMLNVSARIKWPNDIFYRNQKIAGILISNSVSLQYLEDTVIGIGLNVNQNQFSVSRASSISNITGKTYDLQVLFEGLTKSIENRFLDMKNGDRRIIHNSYLTSLFGINERRSFLDPATKIEFEGWIRGVDEIGKLKVEIDGKIKRFGFKEIQFLIK